ncbi:MAG TPA: nuclear transport factor 2 family protein [Lapillicoccus sp.]|uniref:YybH family protein n=1 Tax=Lapillicoccus sp. TaxID=1909287 RepID=UPI002F95AF42
MTGTTRTQDEAQIRHVIEEWAQAVHEGDLPRVLADHADDIVMFDVPPPEDGVRGLDDYTETWPPFFRWQASGATRSLGGRARAPLVHRPVLIRRFACYITLLALVGVSMRF